MNSGRDALKIASELEHRSAGMRGDMRERKQGEEERATYFWAPIGIEWKRSRA